MKCQPKMLDDHSTKYQFLAAFAGNCQNHDQDNKSFIKLNFDDIKVVYIWCSNSEFNNN